MRGLAKEKKKKKELGGRMKKNSKKTVVEVLQLFPYEQVRA